MTEQEFRKFISAVEMQYPKQRALNDMQKGFFWIALRTYNFEDCIKSFAVHTQSSQWKPQVCDIMKHLVESNLRIEKHLKDFLDRKEVKDTIALKVFKILGGNNINKTLEKDYEKLRDKFVEAYRTLETKENFDSLSLKSRNKLLGNT